MPHPTGQLQCAIHGEADAGYGRVVDAFADNFRKRGDLGAACAVYISGRPVVDLWSGVADARTGRQWEADSAAVIFSCSKGVVAICTYLLVQRGLLDLDAPVVHYWPEFGQQGKETMPVRWLLNHRSGLPALDRDLRVEDIAAWHPVIKAIETQRPHWAPGTAHLYHAMTYGWLIGEVIRRITGLTPGAYFRRTLAGPLGLQTWIGLPAAARASVVWMEPPLPDADVEAGLAGARLLAENPIIERSLTMGGAFGFPTRDGVVTFNDPIIQAMEIPAANGISTARSLARLYAACVSDVGQPRLLSAASLDDALVVQSAGRQLSGAPDDGARWGTGFQLSSPPSQPMLGARSFGHAGAGGQLAFGNDRYALGFAYLSNQMGGYGDVRASELTRTLQAVLDG